MMTVLSNKPLNHSAIDENLIYTICGGGPCLLSLSLSDKGSLSLKNVVKTPVVYRFPRFIVKEASLQPLEASLMEVLLDSRKKSLNFLPRLHFETHSLDEMSDS